jgi:hypothetical protein
MSKLGLMLSAACVAATFATAAASAAITTYNDRATFTAATGALNVETFGPQPAFPIPSGILNSSTGGCCAFGPITPGLILPGVTYSTPVGSGLFFNIDADGGFDGGFLDGLFNNGILTISFDSAQSAFGFDTNYLMPVFDLAIFDTNGQIYSNSFQIDPANGLGLSFFGFESSAANIVKITIDGTAGSDIDFAIDNFTFKSSGAGPIPEPSSWAMLLTGFGALGIALRRRRTTARAW